MEIAPLIKDEYLQFTDQTTIAEMLGKLKSTEKQAGLIFRNKKYLGQVEKSKLLRANVDFKEAKVGNFLQATPILSKTTDVIEAARLLFTSDVNTLPVEESKEIIGVVTALDIAAKAIESLPKFKVADIKLEKPPKLTKNDTVSTALEIMRTGHTDHLPIFEQGRLYGIVGYKDIIRRSMNWSPKRDVSGKFNQELRSRAAQPTTDPIADFMLDNFASKNLVTTTNNELLKAAITKMIGHRIKSLIVKENGDYLGLLTIKSILHLIATQRKKNNFGVQLQGLKDLQLTEHQRTIVSTIAEREGEKLQRKIGEPFTIHLHLKALKKTGKQQEFEVKLKIESTKRRLISSKADWNLETALHKCFNMVRTELQR